MKELILKTFKKYLYDRAGFLNVKKFYITKVTNFTFEVNSKCFIAKELMYLFDTIMELNLESLNENEFYSLELCYETSNVTIRIEFKKEVQILEEKTIKKIVL